MFIYSRKAIAPIVAVLLLLAVAVSAGVVVTKWYSSTQSIFSSQVESDASVGDLEILGVKYVDERTSVLGIRNLGDISHTANRYVIDGRECSSLRDNNVGDVTLIYLNCSVNQKESYNVELFSNRGIYSKVTTVLDTDKGIFSIYYKYAGEPCDLGDTKLYGLYYISGSSAEVGSENNYPISVCAYHRYLNLSNSCSGDHVRLFYLGDSTNSHVYTSTGSVRSAPPGYYNWQQVCFEAESPQYLYINFTDSAPSVNSQCAGSFEVDDVLGSHIGGCSVEETNQIWITTREN